MTAEVWNILANIAVILGALFAFSQLKDMKREAQVKEGQRQQEQEQLKKDLEDAKKRIEKLEGDSQDLQIDTAEIKTDVKHILKALANIEMKLDQQKEC